MDNEINELVKTFMQIRREKPLVIDLAVYFSKTGYLARFCKEVRDKAYTLSSFRSYKKQNEIISEITEGESVGVIMEDINGETCEYVVSRLFSFLEKHEKPVSLHLMIDEKNQRFGLGIVDYK